MSAELATLAADPSRVRDVDREQLPDLIGEASALHARLLAALQAIPLQPDRPTTNGEGEPDPMLTAQEAADRLGVDPRWMYRKADALPFTRRLSPGTLRFSAKGLERWKETKR